MARRTATLVVDEDLVWIVDSPAVQPASRPTGLDLTISVSSPGCLTPSSTPPGSSSSWRGSWTTSPAPWRSPPSSFRPCPSSASPSVATAAQTDARQRS